MWTEICNTSNHEFGIENFSHHHLKCLGGEERCPHEEKRWQFLIYPSGKMKLVIEGLDRWVKYETKIWLKFSKSQRISKWWTTHSLTKSWGTRTWWNSLSLKETDTQQKTGSMTPPKQGVNLRNLLSQVGIQAANIKLAQKRFRYTVDYRSSSGLDFHEWILETCNRKQG